MIQYSKLTLSCTVLLSLLLHTVMLPIQQFDCSCYPKQLTCFCSVSTRYSSVTDQVDSVIVWVFCNVAHLGSDTDQRCVDEVCYWNGFSKQKLFQYSLIVPVTRYSSVTNALPRLFPFVCYWMGVLNRTSSFVTQYGSVNFSSLFVIF